MRWIIFGAMVRDPFDLTFEDLQDAGVIASHAAEDEAVRAGIAVATLNAPAKTLGATDARKDRSRKPVPKQTAFGATEAGTPRLLGKIA